MQESLKERHREKARKEGERERGGEGVENLQLLVKTEKT